MELANSPRAGAGRDSPPGSVSSRSKPVLQKRARHESPSLRASRSIRLGSILAAGERMTSGSVAGLSGRNSINPDRVGQSFARADEDGADGAGLGRIGPIQRELL